MFTEINIFLVAGLILIASGLPFFFLKKDICFSIQTLSSLAIITGLTSVHYLGSFYGILIGNIIITTLIIKNAPFFQTLFYAWKYKQSLSKYHYLFGCALILGICCLSSRPHDTKPVTLLGVLIPLISALAWAYLMIFISTMQKQTQTQVLSGGNLLSGIVLFLCSLGFSSGFEVFFHFSWYAYGAIIVLGLLPTFLAPLLWSKAVNKLGSKIIYFDYLTPIITILGSVILFDATLSIMNIIGIGVIVLSFLAYQYAMHAKN